MSKESRKDQKGEEDAWVNSEFNGKKERLKQMLVEKERDIDRFAEDNQILKQLYEDGFIDNDGNSIQR